MVGLCNPLKTNMELQNPSNLQIAMSLARSYEHRGEDDSAEALPPVHGSSTLRFLALVPNRPTKLPPTTPTPVALAAGSASPLVLGVPCWPLRPGPPTTRFRRLTPEEMNDRRLKVLCYNCLAKFIRDHTCSFKGIYLLNLDEDSDEESADTDVEISLHAITGVSTSRTMKLRMPVQGRTSRPWSTPAQPIIFWSTM